MTRTVVTLLGLSSRRGESPGWEATMSATVTAGSVLADRYRLLEKRPSPSFASSWRARDLATGRELGVKVVHMDMVRPNRPRSDALEKFATPSAVPPRVMVTPPYVLLIADQPAVPIENGHVEPSDAPRMTSRTRLAAAIGAVVVLLLFGGAGWLISTTVFGRGVQSVAVPSLSAPRGPGPSSADVPLRPASAQAWSAVRYADNANDAGRAVDSNPATRWSTDTYRSAFGSTEQGIGLVLDFDRTVDIDEVWIASDDVGTAVEIRTAPEKDEDFDVTRVLGSGVLKPGTTHIALDQATETRSILVWISELAPAENGFESSIGEVGASGSVT
ncbi:hypothetical protein DK926_04330 [Rhodococcus sp. Eu-32]|uniref:hypothetical protein n=1 Tax=Rhodococcus sp. Eu-32 TaxID=1017319 RepID=UPI000F7B5885|nr:hypothetical protein [Rhodococcus sp. Eu-32]RRQ29122.1 hypothetical protein DK926_04330 [Rhodococcus sp. Eu-32]